VTYLGKAVGAVDVLIIGHFAKDQVIVDGVTETSSGGSVYFGSIALQHLGRRTAIVTRLHPDDFARLEEVKREGVRVYASPAAATSGIANYYNSQNMERRFCRPLGFAGPFSADEIPPLRARIVFAGPIIAGEIDLDLLKYLATLGPLALDIQGFVRVREGEELVFRRWDNLEEGLAVVTYLKADRAEAELLTGESDLAVAARRLAGCGPDEVLITDSSGVTVYAEGTVIKAPFTSRSLDGRTGRGDTCFASYLGRRLEATAVEACRLAAIITSLKQEHTGPWRGPLEEAEEILSRT
jgi:sugar/nucleoside kinase (ribokinase family)